MSAIRGRIGQFQVLRQKQALVPYLLPIIRFTQQAFFTMLDKERHIVLKPVVGNGFITVVNEGAGCLITTQSKRFEVMNMACAYQVIVQLKENQNYVMQPIHHSLPIWRRPVHRLVTVQKAAWWEMTASTKIARPVLDSVLFKLYERKIQIIACLAAQTLHRAYPDIEAVVLEISVNARGEMLIHDTFLHFSVSKWNQYQTIGPLMPKTALFTPATLLHFLRNYQTIILKPCNGQQGRGVMKVTQNGKQYTIHRGRKQHDVVQAQLIEALQVKDCYIIQQGIPLATIGQSVFDVRVLVKKQHSDWIVHGKAVKVAGEGYIVTNAAQAILHLDEAIRQSTIRDKNEEELSARLDALCLQAAKALDREHKRMIIGFDVGITDEGELFIFEGNYRPDLSMFYQLTPNADSSRLIRYKEEG